jgi:hypothetical protein
MLEVLKVLRNEGRKNDLLIAVPVLPGIDHRLIVGNEG